MSITKPPVVPAWADTAPGTDLMQPSNAFITAGWPLTSIPPSRQFFNWVLNFCANGVRYLSRRGIADWDAAETYVAGDITRDVTDGAYYKATTTSTPGAVPHSDLTTWEVWLDSQKGLSGSYAKKIRRYLNALGQERFVVDHLGFPGGRLVALTERWRGNETIVSTSTAQFTNTDLIWNASLTAGGAGGKVRVISIATAGIPSPLTQMAHLQLGAGGSDESRLQLNAPCIFSNDNAIVMECDVWLDAAVSQQRLAFGLGDGYGDTGGMIGGVFQKGDSDTTWFCRTGDGTALSAAVNSGVTVVASTWIALRVEWHGVNVADNSVAAMRFYINGALVATITTNLPTAAAAPFAVPLLATKRVTGSSTRDIFVRPVRISSNY